MRLFVAAWDFPVVDDARVATEDAAPGSCAQTHTPCAPATASVEPALGRQATARAPACREWRSTAGGSVAPLAGSAWISTRPVPSTVASLG